MIEQPEVREMAEQPSDEHSVTSPAVNAQAHELARARERLSFYESFDSLIRDNVRRSGELLRQVAIERERTDQQLFAMQSELDRQLADQRLTLGEVAAELAGLQANLATIVDRIAASLDALQAPPGNVTASDASVNEERDDRATTGLGEVGVHHYSEPVIVATPSTPHEASQPRSDRSLASDMAGSVGREGVEPAAPAR